jgi:hypothetical protein
VIEVSAEKERWDPGAQKCRGEIEKRKRCWACVIFFARVVESERLRRARRGVRGGTARPPLGGCRGSGATPPKFIFFRTTYFRDHMIFRWFFDTWFFADGFLFPVKVLGFWTNPGHWVRVLDAAGYYMYIVL